MFGRLWQKVGIPRALLKVQYRMHPAIAAFPTVEFYTGQVADGVDEADRPMIAGLAWLGNLRSCFVHVKGTEVFALATCGKSFKNIKEVDTCCRCFKANSKPFFKHKPIDRRHYTIQRSNRSHQESHAQHLQRESE